ncbi:hypothetical protein X943_000914 [Babesia divergens]|uniref:Inositol polyphosphate-related phosphatase domain-containing protein n=1 Tax=Babesia divergens TaxID=32595 RepID=A0AAD9LHQ9_BABDI|nr:hypothetical protein X943_000914 [Babesia divergens]
MEKGSSMIGNSDPPECDNDEYTYVSVKERVKKYDKNRPSTGEWPLSPQHVLSSPLEPTGQRDPKAVAVDVPLSSSPDPSCIARCKLCNPHSSSHLIKCEDNRDLSVRPVRIFVGTWNCVYQDVEESVILKPHHRDHHLSQRITKSVEILSHWLTHVFHRFVHDHSENGKYNNRLRISDETRKDVVKSSRCKYCVSKIGRSAGVFNGVDSIETRLDEASEKWIPGESEGVQMRSCTVHGDTVDKRYAPIKDCSSTDMTIASAADLLRVPVDGPDQTLSKVTTGESTPVRQMYHGSASGRTTMSDVSSTSPGAGPYTNKREVPSLMYLNQPTQHMPDKYSLNKDDPTLTVRQSTLQLKPLTPDDKEPLHDWIPPGYDVYIIALQETLSSSIFTSITKYLQKNSTEVFERVTLEEYKLSGYGDGAFLHMKSTSIAVWVKKALLDSGKARVGKSKVIPLGIINRSKGVVTFQMSVLGQIIGVVGCHMPTRYHDREKAAAYIMKKLPEVYSGSGSSLEDVFHHIVWTGDFNFRVSNISAENALALLNNNLRDQLFSYDEFNRGSASTFSAMNFVEGPVRFFPTYKKRDDRDIVDRSSANWAEAEYHTRYETQWYKGRNVKERVPSWTDRVLKWSVPAFHTCLLIDDDTYRAAQPSVKNILMASDHSPVGCGFSIWPANDVLKGAGVKNLDTTTH